MRKSNRFLLCSLLLAVGGMAFTLCFTRDPRPSSPIVSMTSVPVPPTAHVRRPTVLDEPRVVVREAEKPITTTKTEPEPIVTHFEESPAKDSANLGRVRLIRASTAEERAELDAKLERFLKNQEGARANQNPR